MLVFASFVISAMPFLALLLMFALGVNIALQWVGKKYRDNGTHFALSLLNTHYKPRSDDSQARGSQILILCI